MLFVLLAVVEENLLAAHHNILEERRNKRLTESCMIGLDGISDARVLVSSTTTLVL